MPTTKTAGQCHGKIEEVLIMDIKKICSFLALSGFCPACALAYLSGPAVTLLAFSVYLAVSIAAIK